MKIWPGIVCGLVGVLCLVQQAVAVAASPLTLEWQSSMDDTVTGYAVYYGIDGEPMTNRLDAGTSNSVVVNDLTAGVDYAFYVVAYDADLNESDASNFLIYTAEAISGLELTQSLTGDWTISFSVAPNAACHVEYTDTLAPPNWLPLVTATSDSNGVVTVTDPMPATGDSRFYRAAIDLVVDTVSP